MQAIEYKVSLIGASGSGKSSFLQNLLNTNINYPTLGVDVYQYSFSNNGNKYRFNFWDCAGDNRYLGQGKNYIQDSDYVVLFGDDMDFKQWIPNNIPFKEINSINNINNIDITSSDFSLMLVEDLKKSIII